MRLGPHLWLQPPGGRESIRHGALNISLVLLLLIFLLGVVSGVRTFTGPAVLWIMRYGSPWAGMFSLRPRCSEYFYDVHPKAPPRNKHLQPCRPSPQRSIRWLVGSRREWNLSAVGLDCGNSRRLRRRLREHGRSGQAMQRGDGQCCIRPPRGYRSDHGRGRDRHSAVDVIDEKVAVITRCFARV